MRKLSIWFSASSIIRRIEAGETYLVYALYDSSWSSKKTIGVINYLLERKYDVRMEKPMGKMFLTVTKGTGLYTSPESAKKAEEEKAKEKKPGLRLVKS